MPDHDGDKSQAPTPHRRQKAREEGQVARSQDLGSAVLLLAGMMALLLAGPRLVSFLLDYGRSQLGGAAWVRADVGFAVWQWGSAVSGLARAVLPIFGAVLLAAIAVNLAQVGFLFLPSRVQLDFSHLDPFKGARRLFSMHSLARLVFGLFKLAVVASVAAAVLYGEKEAILGLGELDVGELTVYMIRLLVWTTVKIGAALFVLALLDYGFQRWKHEQDLKMTPQEVREEMRNLEGDPQVIARRRAVQRQLVLHRLSEAVPKADVVVTDPTETAIAIQYDAKTMEAPIVVAKGAGLIAQRIRRLAMENGIPLVEKKPLAQALYREVEVGRPIPHQRYAAVAEVLAYVYQLQRKPRKQAA